MVLPENVAGKLALRLFPRRNVCNDGDVRRPKEVVMSRFNDNEFVPDDDVDDYDDLDDYCLLYTSPSPRDVEESRMPSSA